MNRKNLFKGIGIGLVAGGVLAASVHADKHRKKRKKQFTIKTANEMLEHVTDVLGF